jgi:peptidoglycan/LPS O-acetylase OafA/YrhL
MFDGLSNAFRSTGAVQRCIPSLDGLRAVSISFVIFAHLTGTQHFPLRFSRLGDIGEFGVRVFFVISGFLITSILLRELQRDGAISVGRFYFRRAMRLFPAAYALIAAVVLLDEIHLLEFHHSDLVYALTYTMNYHELKGWHLGHLWSLAIEEQFYVLWPFLLTCLRPARSARLLLIVVAIAPILRLFAPHVAPAFNFLIWSDALATGCLLAMWREHLVQNRFYSRLLASPWIYMCPILAVAANFVKNATVYGLVSVTAMNLCIAISIDWAMRNSESFIGRLLNLPLISFIGVLSYSLYLWQELFLDRYSHSPLCAFPLNVVLAVAAALLSYFLIEAPFLRLRTTVESAMASARITLRH